MYAWQTACVYNSVGWLHFQSSGTRWFASIKILLNDSSGSSPLRASLREANRILPIYHSVLFIMILDTLTHPGSMNLAFSSRFWEVIFQLNECLHSTSWNNQLTMKEESPTSQKESWCAPNGLWCFQCSGFLAWHWGSAQLWKLKTIWDGHWIKWIDILIWSYPVEHFFGASMLTISAGFEFEKALSTSMVGKEHHFA